MKHYNDFTNLFSLSKTLRFELRPVGKTAENIKNSNLISKDESRANDYQIVKKAIDKFHRLHIEEALSLVLFKDSDIDGFIEEFETLYFKKDKEEKDRKGIEEYQKHLREFIVSSLQGKESKKAGTAKKKQNSDSFKKIKERYDILFSKDLFDNEEFISLSKEFGYDEIIQKFKGFSTYFTGFHENRKNMYSAGSESTAIAYRIIHENLPKYLENKRNYPKIKEILGKAKIASLEKELKDVLGNIKIDDFFTVDYFQNTLNQSGIDKYNTLLGGKPAQEGERKVQGLNEIINLTRQQNPEQKIPSLKILYKQILSESDGSFRVEAFDKDMDLLESVKEFWEEIILGHRDILSGKKKNLLMSVEKLSKKINAFSKSKLDEIFIENKNLTNISHQVFGEWGLLNKSFVELFDMLNKDKPKTKALEKEKDKFLKQEVFSLRQLEEAFTVYRNLNTEYERYAPNAIQSYLSDFKIKVTENKKDNWISIKEEIENAYKVIEPILKEDRKEEKNLHQDKKKVEKIKAFLDSLKHLQGFLKLLHISEAIEEKNHEFYDEWESYYEAVSHLNSLYNKARNYLTRKAYSEEKFKLNFESPTLLNGWDKNKETANLAVILRKDELYYLGIMGKKNNKIFEGIPKPKEKTIYEKMIYKLLPGPNKMLPKVFFSEKGLNTYLPPKEVLRLYEAEEFKKGEAFKLTSLHRLIDFYKDAISRNEDWKTFGFKFSPTKQFEDISAFYKEVEEQGYKIDFEKVDSSYIDSLVEEGKLHLFQIYNKDFSTFSKGKPNLHTIYWRSLFDKENLKRVVYKLNGEAEVFYRPKSINYSKDIMEKGHHAKELAGKFKYPIIKDKRFSEDKFQFHVPIKLNFSPRFSENINPLVNDFLQQSKDFHIIGIDRGERHLLYLSLINAKGEIVEQRSLNSILNEHSKKEIDYRGKLDAKEGEREKARENWDVIENIKELKEGYLSLIVHQISKLMVEKKAILVMEDLNFGFKRGRFKVEKQVYQKFERMMIEKLNYLMFKDTKPSEPGGSLNAFQLSNQFESFQKLGKQSGMIFYVPANHTSKIDPITGFFNFLYPDVTSLEKGKEFFAQFDKIVYNSKKDYFEFHCRYGNFVSEPSGDKKKDDLAIYNKVKNKVWVICSNQEERFRSFKNNSGHIEYKQINVNEELKKIFQEEKIDYAHGKDLKESITSSDKSSFLKSMADQLKILLALRYNNGLKGTDERDFILSPVANNEGKFFHSEKTSKANPNNADANGAYNIALKGLLLIEKIKAQKGNKKMDLKISNLDWFEYAWSRNE